MVLVAGPSLTLCEETWNTGLTLAARRSSLCPGSKVTSLLPGRKTVLGPTEKGPDVACYETDGTAAPGHQCASNKKYEYMESNYP